MFILNLFWAAFCSELQFLVCVKIFNFESTVLRLQDAGRPMTEEQKRKKRERERERQNGTPVIA